MSVPQPFVPPKTSDAPFHCPPDTVLDIPVPPSVNRTRKIDYASIARINAWKQAADAALWASGQFKAAQKRINRFELHVLLDEQKCRLDQDNGLKIMVDYLRRLEIIVDDNKKHWRKTTIEWGSAPEGIRLTVRPCA